MKSILKTYTGKLTSMVVALGSLTMSCAKSDVEDVQSSSEVLWGASASEGFGSLLEIAPGAKPIGICYENSANNKLITYALNGVKIWADTISRSALIPAAAKPCTQINNADFSRVIKVRKTSQGSCSSPGVVGYYDGSSINFCNSAFIGSEIIAIHEMGHAWGLCDQYADNNPITADFNANCAAAAGAKSTKAQSNSIMSAGRNISIVAKWLHPSLYEDDIIGIRMMSCLADIPANAEWAKNNCKQIQSWKQDSKFSSELQRSKSAGTNLLEICTSNSPC